MNNMKTKIGKCLLAGALCATTLAAGAGVSHAALGVDFGSDVAGEGYVENGGPGTFGASSGYSIVGWSFKPTTDLFLTRLGVYDADRDRIHSEQHYVGIWSADSSSLLASVTINEATLNVPETSPYGAKFHFANTASPVVLRAGQTYVVGATLYAGTVTSPNSTSDYDSFAAFDNGDSPIHFNPYVSYIGNAYSINDTNTLVMPTSSFATDFTVGANIDVTPTPIPAAFWLLGSGLAGLTGIKRRTFSL